MTFWYHVGYIIWQRRRELQFSFILSVMLRKLCSSQQLKQNFLFEQQSFFHDVRNTAACLSSKLSPVSRRSSSSTVYCLLTFKMHDFLVAVVLHVDIYFVLRRSKNNFGTTRISYFSTSSLWNRAQWFSIELRPGPVFFLRDSKFGDIPSQSETRFWTFRIIWRSRRSGEAFEIPFLFFRLYFQRYSQVQNICKRKLLIWRV